ncbi:LOW QUALITY PROTEIN: MLV-related proviral Env polyprotein-like [Peromyscus leucopus]|uniref:LOW QUALITY PROTEIN: MLV-related proviral Env polyprotein-like n=1 Tax=Peromyscus leucopus TaxID=10041 RepID=UPI001884F7E0|nr:LOW QUALITY PROTEIN: MLV-related proviral Env polyprotein-like [Peromyscus leucopus]
MYILLVLKPGLAGSPHQVYNITWSISNLLTGKIVNQTSGMSTLGEFYPEIWFDACDLTVDHDTCLTTDTRTLGYYACPRAGRTPSEIRRCGGADVGFCGAWGCETTGTTFWNPTSSWDLIILRKTPGFKVTEINGKLGGTCINGTQGRCHPLILTFTAKARKEAWDSPKPWGMRLYRPVARDPISIFTISRSFSTGNHPVAVGPNPVLKEQKPLFLSDRTSVLLHSPLNNPTVSPRTDRSGMQLATGSRLLSLIQGAHLTLNLTAPNWTRSCWLCLVSNPPYYEGVAVLGNFTNHTSPPHGCSQAPQHKLTLSEVSGTGTCVGTVPTTHQALCNTTQQMVGGSYYLASPNGTYWACSSGLTQCISVAILNVTYDYCVMVELWPKIIYHAPEYVLNYYKDRDRLPREPISLTLTLLMEGLTVCALEESISALEKSLTSLSEVVLQNRRGLDILFLQEGGLCAALKEECCFYADHTGFETVFSVITLTIDNNKCHVKVAVKAMGGLAFSRTPRFEE